MTGHQCKHLFIIEVQPAFESEDEYQQASSNPEISLAAITGIQPRPGYTMRLRVTIGHITLVVLLDSGSTHNFIANNVVVATGIVMRLLSGLSITMANGDRVTSLGLCCTMTIRIGDEEFALDCYAMPLDGFDVILGVQ